MLLTVFYGPSGAAEPPAITGTAALDGNAGTLAASGAQSFSGSAALTGQSGSLVAVGSESFAGSGALVGAPGAIAASGVESFSGSGALVGVQGSFEAVGALGFEGDSELEGRAGVLEAEAEEIFAGAAEPSGASGELGAFGTVGDPPVTDITGTADLVGNPGEITAIGEYTPLAITGEAAVVGNPGELSATDAEPEAPPVESPSMGGGYVVTRRGATVTEETDQPTRDVQPPAAELSAEMAEALSSGSTGEPSSREADTLIPEPAGSAEVVPDETTASGQGNARTETETLGGEVADSPEPRAQSASSLSGAASPDETVSEVTPITPEAINAILAEREGEREREMAEIRAQLAAAQEQLAMAEAFAVVLALVAAGE